MLPLLLVMPLQSSSLKLPAIFADNMVLQRDMPIPFFGSGTPGNKVMVQVGSRTAETTVKPDGTWLVKLRPMPAGGPYAATVTSESTVRFKNVLIGEVWVASGQSNMEWPQAAADDVPMALKEADPYVRMFTVEKVSTEQPQKDVKGSWQVGSKGTVLSFSAVANSFAKELNKALGVPVGIIHTSWGGTPAESWTSRDALLSYPNLASMVNGYLADIKDFPTRRAAYEKAYADWSAKVVRKDPGNVGFTKGWANPDTDVSDWRMVVLPNAMETTEAQNMDGIVWYRRVVDVPAGWVGKPLTLELGAIDDNDITYVNGRKVGETAWHATPRIYRVPANYLHAGQNVIAVRVFDTGGVGGFTGVADQMKWAPEDKSTDPIGLAGNWLSKVEVTYEPPSPQVIASQPQEPFGPGNPWAPGGLYNGMLAPLMPYGIRGAIWYQGESNAGRAYQYRELFPAMIRDWRVKWGQGDFPFYFVQLANFTERNKEPIDSDWAELREAQSMTLALPNTGQAVTIDIGEAGDIHPRNKREVGRRLALNALSQTYRMTMVSSGPVYDRIATEPGKLRVKFKNASGLRAVEDAPITGFAVAGADRKFYWAQAKVDGDTVVVWSPSVALPVAVRYGWSNNPAVNLINGAGLPASPFRSDDWPGVTKPK